MTKYRLKNAELQRKLDELSGGDFSKCLENIDPKINAPNSGGGIFIAFGHRQLAAGFEDGEGNFRRHQIAILFEDLILEKTYDPHGWNDFPAVTPPEGPLMRLEYNNQIGAKRKACATYFNGEWISFDGFKIEPRNARFRPWEDEE